MRFILLQHLFYFIAHETTPLDKRNVYNWCCGKEAGLDVLEERVYHGNGKIREVDHLREHLIEKWVSFEHKIIDNAIDRTGATRLRACVEAKGRQFNHSLRETVGLRRRDLTVQYNAAIP